MRNPKMNFDRTSKARRRRCGSLSVELLLILPILSVLVLGILQMSLTIAATERLTQASQVGARVAAQGGSQEDVEEAVHHALGNGNYRKAKIEITTCDREGDDGDHGHPGHHGDDDRRGHHDDADRSHDGHPDADEQGHEHDWQRCRGECVKVCVRIHASCVVPGPLIIFGCKDEVLVGCTVMRKE